MTEPLTLSDYQRLASFRHGLRLFLRFSEEAARIEGLTPAQHQLLLVFKGHPSDEAPSTTDIAEALQLRLHSAVELVSRAEANGLVVRSADPTDHRRSRLTLTPAGDRHLARLSAQHRAELRNFRDQMNDLLDSLGPTADDAVAGRET